MQSLRGIKRVLFARRREAESRALARLRAAGQIAWLLLHDALEGRLDRHARGLVYSTLIAVIPLLVFAVIALKALGAHGALAPALHQLLAPLGDGGVELANRLLAVVGQVHFGVLGAFGILLLAFSAGMLLTKIESGLDAAWQVRNVHVSFSRSLRYLGLLIVGPVLLLAAFGVTATLTNNSVIEHLSIIGAALPVLGKIVPYLIAMSAFALLNLITPNTRVRLRAALVAGLWGGLVWQGAGQLFAFLTARSTQLSAVYSGFAILILFLTWLYVSWLILLLSGRLGFYMQNPTWRRPAETLRPLAPANAESAALDIMTFAATRFAAGGKACELGEFVGRLGVPGICLESVLEQLTTSGLLIEIRRQTYMLARNPDRITVTEVVDAVRGEDEAGPAGVAAEFLRRLRDLRKEALADTTLADFAADAVASREKD